MVYLGGMLRPIVDHLSGKAWRGTRGDEGGQFLLRSSDLGLSTSTESMHEGLTAMYTHARRWAPGLEIPFFVPPVQILIGAREMAGNFRLDEERYATIGVSIDHVGDAEATLLILAHEACHHILRQSQLNQPDNIDLDEVTTDLAMFVCGFGELVLRGYSRVGFKHGEARRSGVHLGYLSAAEYQEAHDYVLSLRASQRLPGRVDLAALVVDAPERSRSTTGEARDGTADVACGDAMCKRTFRATLRRHEQPWPIQCPACGVSLYPVDVLERADAGTLKAQRAELRLQRGGRLVACTSGTLRRMATPVAAEAAAPLDTGSLLDDILEATAAAQDTPAPANHAEPPAQPQSSPPQLPSRRREERVPWTPPDRSRARSEEVEWAQLDEKMARRHGLPALIPLPGGQLEKIAEEGLSVEVCRRGVTDFLLDSEAGKSGVWRKKNSVMVSALEAFVDKGPLWDKAQKAFAANEHERVITALKRIVAMDPEDHAARLDLAFTLATTGDNPGALKAFKAIRKTFEGEPDYHVAVGRAHLALGDTDSALNEMVRALEAKADCRPALEAMAQMGIVAVAEYICGRRAEATARADEKARAEEAARTTEKARAKAASEAEEKALIEARAKIRSVSTPLDPPPRSSDELDPPKALSRMRDNPLDTAKLPELNASQKQRMMDRGQKALAEAAARAKEPARVKVLPEAAADEALFALVDLGPGGSDRDEVLPEGARDEALPRTNEEVAGKQEKAQNRAADDARAAAETQAKECDDALARAKEDVARAKEMALAETAARAKEKARSVRRAVLLVAALILAVALAILGNRMLSH